MPTVKRLAICSAILFLCAHPARADGIAIGDTVTFAPGLGSIGGPTLVTINNDPSTTFESFCMQANVGGWGDFSTTMVVTGVTDYATYQPMDQGGDQNGNDYLTSQTAWLYTQFRNTGLGSDGFDYSSSNSYDALQWAIWQLQGEKVIPDGMGFTSLANTFIAAANDAVANGFSGIGDVRVLNLNYAADGTDAQDQLTFVPEPTTIELLGLGILALYVGRRRFGRSIAAISAI